MKIKSEKVVMFHYRLKNAADELLEESFGEDPTAYLHGHRNIIRGLEDAMEGREAGEKFTTTVPPGLGYGVRREDSKQRVPIKHLMTKGKLKPGMTVSVQTEQGARQMVVIKAGKFNVDLDTNHPLAGETLTFEVEIMDVRDATPNEISHGHAHGIGGHHH